MNKIAHIREIIHRALTEDIGDGDITTNSIVSETAILSGGFIAKEAGIIAGLELAHETLKLLDLHIIFTPLVSDGESVPSNTEIAKVKGRAHALLSAERTALNFLQRMSGIATTTRAYVDAAKAGNPNKKECLITDTRKTAPGLRLLDKWAVRLGGGLNHRFGLYDMALIKENHIAAAGGIKQAVESVRKMNKHSRPIEVEVQNLNELQEAISLDVDRILLDNMNLEQLTQAVRITNGRVELEASGNVSLENVAEFAKTGVDIISVGKLTHSVKALDISFLIR